MVDLVQIKLNPKFQDLSKSAFEFAVWSRTTQPKSAKICPNLHFGGWWEWGLVDLVLTNLSVRCQDLSKSAFWEDECGPRPTQPKSSKICPNLHFGGGVVIQNNST